MIGTIINVVNAMAYGNGKLFAFGSDIVEVPVPPVSSLIPITPTNQVVTLSIYAGHYFEAGGSCLTPPVYFQWKHNGTNLPGMTNTTLYLAPISTNDSGQYTLFASNALGQIEYSEVAQLTVVAPPNAAPIIGYPTTRVTNSVPVGYDASLNATA